MITYIPCQYCHENLPCQYYHDNSPCQYYQDNLPCDCQCYNDNLPCQYYHDNLVTMSVAIFYRNWTDDWGPIFIYEPGTWVRSVLHFFISKVISYLHGKWARNNTFSSGYFAHFQHSFLDWMVFESLILTLNLTSAISKLFSEDDFQRDLPLVDVGLRFPIKNTAHVSWPPCSRAFPRVSSPLK